jgi:uncharacterized protein YndB with AHSA1/START domain
MDEQTDQISTDQAGARRSGVAGSLRASGERATVRMQDRYPTHPEDLWAAVTEPERLARWIAVVDGVPGLGGTVHARFTSGWEGDVRVEVCEPPRRLIVTSAPGRSDETTIEAVLTRDGDSTLLVVEERGISLEQVAAYGAGWQAHIEDLAAHLAGRDAGGWATRWTELAPAYAEQAHSLA